MNGLKKIIFLTALICLSFLIITGCKTAEKTEKIITGGSPKEIEVRPGDVFVIILDENPSTGFIWHYRIADKDIAVLDADQFIPPPPNKNIVGAGGKHNWKFRAVKKGITKITFDYYREWEKNNIATAYEFTVTVR